MQKLDSLVASGFRLALILLFFHRCGDYSRWSLRSTQTLQTNQPVTGDEPFPALAFIFALDHNLVMLSKEYRLKIYVWEAQLRFDGTYK